MNSLRLDLINKYLKSHRRTLILGGITLLIVNLLSVAIPMEVKEIIDGLKDDFTLADIFKQAGWIIVLATAMGVVRLLSRQLVFGVGRQVEVELRQKLFNHMIHQDPNWLQEVGSGEIITRSTSDIENIRRLLGFAILSLTNTFLAYAFTLPAMLRIDPLMTLASISLYPLMLGIVGMFGGRMVRQRKRQQESLSALSELIQEDLSGISAIKIYGQEKSEIKAFSTLNNNYRDSAIKLARTASTLFPLLQGISSISLLILIAIGSGRIQEQTITIGGLIALILYVERLVFPTALLGFTLNTFQLGQVSLDRVEKLLNRESLIQDPKDPVSINKKIKGKLEARNLSFKYEGSKQNTLNNLNFTIEPGELIAIVGPIGCGKTTLSRVIGRMIQVSKKQLFLDGYDILDLRLHDLRQNIALVPQEGYLFTNSLADNLRYGDPNASQKRVETSASQAKLIDDVRGFPNGFNTLVGERGITLSGGQRQRTALGRALLIKAPLIVLDDALASVDNKTASGILNSIRNQTNSTVIMISHQLSAAAACDRVLVMENGEIVQEGHHSDLIKTNGLYKRLWEREKAVESIKKV
ncbi:ABC transporter ATP-binding protein [Prochlorococcus sp. MIT 1223]|uniref:ABC transporter ATP-binding protein n=1 Tax=Prochlorococcus sp. MIT 1223 TaxID=3096217 RepID=UPI002A75A60F|nr:ABC transporter ATP-binding protein [Prochlorococcus sp. MIT 1223]